jgi:hypothetical protein
MSDKLKKFDRWFLNSKVQMYYSIFFAAIFIFCIFSTEYTGTKDDLILFGIWIILTILNFYNSYRYYKKSKKENII